MVVAADDTGTTFDDVSTVAVDDTHVVITELVTEPPADDTLRIFSVITSMSHKHAILKSQGHSQYYTAYHQQKPCNAHVLAP